jgi:chitodextrinase
MRAATLLLLVLANGPGCAVDTLEPPPFTGPSELGLRVRLQAVPDTILQDGLAQTTIHIEVSGADGRPVGALPLRVDVIFDGVIQDFGAVSSKAPVTDIRGRASVIYTSPPRPSQPVDEGSVVTIAVTPIGNDFRGELPRTIDVRLATPGVVLPPNSPPRPQFSFSPSAPQVFDSVVFDASESTDEGEQCGAGCAYDWEFGDGSTGTGVFASHQYLIPGTMQVRLTVTDVRGASAWVARALAVIEGPPPTASFVFSPANPGVGQRVFFTAEASRAGTGRQIVSYEWNFGSGRTATGITTSTTYEVPGAYVVTLTVVDNAGRRATISQAVAVGRSAVRIVQ